MKIKSIMGAATGAVLLAAGYFLVVRNMLPEEARAVAFAMVGLGCGLFGHGVGALSAQRAAKKNPEAHRQFEIEQQDERNVVLSNAAKARAYDVMVFVFGALMFAFAMMGVDMMQVLLFVAAYLFVVGCNIFYRFKYEKEM